MDYIVREIKADEYPLLSDFLYEAIFIPDGVEPPPRSIVHSPELQVYIAGFGDSEHDRAFVAEAGGAVVGAAWVRIMDDYGHVDDDTPSLAISVYPEYRGLGIGTELLKKLLASVRERGYLGVSLSVQRENYAVKMYKKAGFRILAETEEEYIMVVKF